MRAILGAHPEGGCGHPILLPGKIVDSAPTAIYSVSSRISGHLSFARAGLACMPEN